MILHISKSSDIRWKRREKTTKERQLKISFKTINAYCDGYSQEKHKSSAESY